MTFRYIRDIIYLLSLRNGRLEMTENNRPCVYILRCKDGTLYTGWTNDFKKRLATHNSGKGAKYTRGRTPVTPVYLEYAPDRQTAVKREAAIKKLPLQKKLQLLDSSLNRLRAGFKE